ncbi:uncharacterized protein E6C27_scaffold1591G00530 [Cucumis melo var. makuwa]|uniref:CACTA en-spm transposon protein n=1 Tax=Cucumis melo var. makuwa TaxID=1194695 RepID=A0A5A7U3K1_CUCMM|nr:uncharacterized protein E6C27_scaffold1591G00530 [Cucumis melo var. makuwa]
MLALLKLGVRAWADVTLEYIKVVKGDLQCWFKSNFGDRALTHFKQPRVNKVARVEQPYNYSRTGEFVLEVSRMLELQSEHTPKSLQPLSGDEICETMLGRQPSYSKGLGWGPKPKS